MERKLSVAKATEHCSCNSCHAKNYIDDERFDEKVVNIFDVRIGNFCNRLCMDCLEHLINIAKISLAELSTEHSRKASTEFGELLKETKE